MKIRNAIIEAITQNYNPAVLEVVDESHKHADHSGSHPEGESHFLIKLSAASLPTSRVQRERDLRRIIDAATLPRNVHAIRFQFI